GYSSVVIRLSGRPSVRSRSSWTTWQAFASVRLPTTTLSTSRLAASKATWSQQSPQRSSPGRQRFCFLATNDHFSSSCTSWVAGGKSHELVVGLLGVGTGPQGVADDGIFIDADQACGLADATAVLQVLADGHGPTLPQSASQHPTPPPPPYPPPP